MRILPSLFTLSTLVLCFSKAWRKGIIGSKAVTGVPQRGGFEDIFFKYCPFFSLIMEAVQE